MLFVLLLVALLGLWIWSLMNMPSKQARAIFEAHGETPESVSDRDRAYVLDLHRKFGTEAFSIKSIQHRPLDPEIAGQFGVKPARLDDVTELGIRLPKLKLLVSFEPGRFRLTEDAARMAERLERTNMSLENA
ncbi:MAG: hypothetical protein VX593_03755 [Pseudomonadota bacterium]|nr:hypothetical protein [Pseudomonadota bacterium]